MRKRIISFLLVICLVFSFSQTLCIGANPQPIFVEGNRILKGASRYSSADKGYTSGIDDQLSTEVCWTFTHNELIEINVAKKTGQKYDLSEQTMKFETSKYTNSLYGFERRPNDGGNEYMSTAFLARGGVTLEKDEPFSTSELRFVLPQYLAYYGVLKSVPMLEFGQGYNEKAVTAAKKLISQYGAVGSSLYFVKGSRYQNESKSNYYYNGGVSLPDHAVTIVGWDDNYSASNFAVKPKGDGAFIVKNSWGKYHNNLTDDLVYVSYYDKFITYQLFATDFDMQNDVYDNIYQYDYFGFTDMGAYQTNSMIYATKYRKTSPGQALSAVSTYVVKPGSTVEVLVNVTDSDVKTTSKFRRVYSKTFENMGYYLMEFDEVPIKGNEFAVAIRVTKAPGDASVWFPLQSNSGGLVTNAMQAKGTCYISGSNLANMQAIETSENLKNVKAMLAMKAFTVNTGVDMIDSARVFDDISSTAWYKPQVDYAVTYGLFDGASNNLFMPDGKMTRAQFVQVLANISGVNTMGGERTQFSDVSQSDWFSAAVKWASDNDIVSGDGNGKFLPSAVITREQMCVMLTQYVENYLGIKMSSADYRFDDHAKISSWARAEVYKCYKSGLVSGDGKGSFNPKSQASRAEGATIFTQFHKKYIL